MNFRYNYAGTNKNPFIFSQADNTDHVGASVYFLTYPAAGCFLA